MNRILDQMIFDNTLRMYCIVFGVILFMVLVKRYVAQIIANLLFQVVKAVWKDVDRKSFTGLVTKPMGFFLTILVIVITFHQLKFPARLDADIYRLTVRELVHTVASIVLIVAFIRLLIRIIDFIAIILHIKANRTQDVSDSQLIVFFKDFFKVVLSIIGLLMILKYAFGFQISNLLTGLSLVGAAIALALRESLENLIASFIIFFDKPFSTGDVLKVHAFTGTVEKIGLRSTRIRTDQKTFISVPNKQMVDSIVDNLSLRTQRKGELRLELDPNTNTATIQKFIDGIKEILGRKEIESSTVMLNDITASAFNILVDYFTGMITFQEFNVVKEEINFSVLNKMDELGISVAKASTEVRVIPAENTRAGQ